MKAVVTGGASGLGREISVALRNAGYDVFVYDLPTHDVRTPPLRLDLGQVDVLVNCAGVNHIAKIEDLGEDDWDFVMDVNVKGILMMTKLLLPYLKQTQGTIVNIVSDASHRPMTASAAYCASKGAAHILTQQMARELGRLHDITVFGISPIRLAGTGMSRQVDEQVSKMRGWTIEETKLQYIREVPPKLVADFLAFLLSDKDRHRYLAGCVLPYGSTEA